MGEPEPDWDFLARAATEKHTTLVNTKLPRQAVVVELDSAVSYAASLLKVSKHAVDRFIERGGKKIMIDLATLSGTRINSETRYSEMLQRLTVIGLTSEKDTLEVWDTTQGRLTKLVKLRSPDAESQKGVVTRIKSTNMIALVSDDCVVTVLTSEMVLQNQTNGWYLRPDKTPFPSQSSTLKHPLMKEPPLSDVDNAMAFSWAKQYFAEHEEATVGQALKAANNSKPRIPPVQNIFSKARHAAQAERFEALQKKKLAEAAKPQLPPETSKLPAPHKNVGKLVSLCNDCVLDRALKNPLCRTCSPQNFTSPLNQTLALIPPTIEVSPMAALPSASTLPITVAARDAALGAAAKAVLAVMQQYGLAGVIMTVTDEPKKASWDVQYKQVNTGGCDL